MGIEDRIAALEARVQALEKPGKPATWSSMGYTTGGDVDPLAPFMLGSVTPQARAVAKHRFDVLIGNRVVTPLDDEYGSAYRLMGRFKEVERDLQARWLAAILRDGGLDPGRVDWYSEEFDN